MTSPSLLETVDVTEAVDDTIDKGDFEEEGSILRGYLF